MNSLDVKKHSDSILWIAVFFMYKVLIGIFLFCLAGLAIASEAGESPINLTRHPLALINVGIFAIAYILVMMEEYTKMRKSKPVLLCAGIIWGSIAWLYMGSDKSHLVLDSLEETLLEYAELLLFLLVAMTYINAMEERRLFLVLKEWLVKQKLSLRNLFWITGLLSFFISPFADNLTTALLMASVVIAVGGSNRSFVCLSCINIVVAANAGGAFSPFGDLTTLMVWQSEILSFDQFFVLFIPSLVSFIIPACFMQFFIPIAAADHSPEKIELKRGAFRIIFLFFLTILTAVCFHSFFDLPPAVGMMVGLSYLQFFGYYLRMSLPRSIAKKAKRAHVTPDQFIRMGHIVPFDVFNPIARAEWDTLMFFYGIVMCIGGLSFIGYLEALSLVTYSEFGPTIANILIGLFSAVLDNIPVMFAVLQMNPEMNDTQWLLVTLTAGIGGSLLATGSAAGVALLGHAKGSYTFFHHLQWLPVIAAGYFAAAATHLFIQSMMAS